MVKTKGFLRQPCLLLVVLALGLSERSTAIQTIRWSWKVTASPERAMLALSLVCSYLAVFRLLLARGVFSSLWIDSPMSYLSVVSGQPHHTGRTVSSEVRTAHPGQLYISHLPQDSNPPMLPTNKKKRERVLHEGNTATKPQTHKQWINKTLPS